MSNSLILPDPAALVAKNSRFYDAFWARTYLTRPESFNTWPLVSALVPAADTRLEIGPGLRPRLPVAGTHFLDLSPTAVSRLQTRGGLARTGEITALPYPVARFGLVAAFDVIEHVADDGRAFAELTRVLQPGGGWSFPCRCTRRAGRCSTTMWGHARRYEPAALQSLLAGHGLVVEQSAVFGMQSNNPRLLRFAVDWLTKNPALASACYNWLFFPLGLLLQSRLKWTNGLMDLGKVDEVILVCRRGET